MKLPIPFLSAIETAINTWMKLDGESLEKLKPLEGKIIRFHITGLELNLYFLPAVAGISVLGNYPEEKEGGMVDATIHGSPMALIRLSTAENSGETLLKSDVEIDGDMRIAEKFSAVLREIDIDWEEHLSRLVGDIVAHQAGQFIRGASRWLNETNDAMKMNTAEYINEEAKLSPADAEVKYYMDQVDDLRMGVDRLDARISNLTSNLKKSDNASISNNKKA
ncbi:SCP2 sterol-binding domain-containing protein [Cocleimonas sp. KMM 6892]|uniref:ubiquinone biosynthesis accessory factor UbiJ n=1 Tax=unclassified Cocleimonas TaxID=2639732 RepID=UPI002DB6EDD0|nr:MULTISPECIES: SCP2 sterol-binding domain-containing protein [unclassified Cocleimonas]MEB8431775.1 SCP2 sterol-binding domain-containing protein [Cocleimonas sp. KMM 6892]MEC4715139.1 SCP2 sterol-binding domain-containing protein [Cocleimonas sp. KMM 6895]MEC4744047.1 SCP2 sterol-binding domain-containing protein [Cocleimonas sp. KMM 6896]